MAVYENRPWATILSGLFSNRPAPVSSNCLYWSTDTGRFFLCTGTDWIELSVGGLTGAITDTQHGARGPVAGAHAHGDMSGVTANQHHAQLHAAAHASGAGDQVDHDALQNFDATRHRQLTVGTLAARPAAGTANRFYWASDTRQFFRDTGTAWDEVAAGVAAGQYEATLLAPSAPVSI